MRANGINIGWVNDCGIQLFTIGWVPCREEGAGGGPIEEVIRRRKELSEKVRRAAEEALLRRRQREALEAERWKVLNSASIKNIDSSLKKLFAIDARIEKVELTILEKELKAKKARHKRDKIAITLLLQ